MPFAKRHSRGAPHGALISQRAPARLLSLHKFTLPLRQLNNPSLSFTPAIRDCLELSLQSVYSHGMRIGFLAITGLRVANGELLDFAMQFQALSLRANQIASLPSLGLLTLAGMTPEHIDQEYLEIADTKNCQLPMDCDVVAITALAATEKEVIQLVQRCGEVGIITIVGGLHATLKPDAFTPFANCVVIGEGEVVWPQIIADLEEKCLKPTYNAKAIASFDMGGAPMPAFELLSTGEGRRFTVQTQRGCPWDCDFCAASMRLAPFKIKPVAKVVSEIERISELYGENFVEFADDNTFANCKHSIALLDALAKTNVRFFAETDLSIADDPELLWRMRDAGCQEVLIGFESPDFNALDGVEQRVNWKAKRVDRALRAVEKIQRTGIAVCGCFVLGLDGAGPDSFFKVREFIEKSGVFDVQLTYLTPFPGTPLHTRLTEEGRILSAAASELYTLFDINFEPNGMNIEALENGYRKLMAQLYTDGAVRDRRKRFFSHLRSRIREKRPTNPSFAA